MCGLVGVAGTQTHKSVDTFKQLLCVDGVRGMHSTGVASVSFPKDRVKWQADMHMFKHVETPYELIQYGEFKSVVNWDKNLLMGHNRHATVGKVNKHNAHPFMYDSLVGMHNGTLSNRHVLDKAFDFETDSAALYYNIHERGVEKVIPLIKGAWALTWYDNTTETINLLKNKERPLCFTFSKDYKQFWWCSEAGALSWILKRNGIEYEKIHQLADNVHISMRIPDEGKEFEDVKPFIGKELKGASEFDYRTNYYDQKKVNTSTKKKDSSPVNGPCLVKPEIPEDKELDFKDLKGEVAKRAKVYLEYCKDLGIDMSVKGTVKSSGGVILLSPPKEDKEDKHRTYKGWRGEELTKEQFDEATKYSCEMCKKDVEWGETVRFICEDRFVCMDCKDLPMVQGILAC